MRALKNKKKTPNFPEPQEIKRDQKRRVRWAARVGQSHARPLPEAPLQRVAVTAPAAQITNQRGRVFYANCQPQPWDRAQVVLTAESHLGEQCHKDRKGALYFLSHRCPEESTLGSNFILIAHHRSQWQPHWKIADTSFSLVFSTEWRSSEFSLAQIHCYYWPFDNVVLVLMDFLGQVRECPSFSSE